MDLFPDTYVLTRADHMAIEAYQHGAMARSLEQDIASAERDEDRVALIDVAIDEELWALRVAWARKES